MSEPPRTSATLALAFWSRYLNKAFIDFPLVRRLGWHAPSRPIASRLIGHRAAGVHAPAVRIWWLRPPQVLANLKLIRLRYRLVT